MGFQRNHEVHEIAGQVREMRLLDPPIDVTNIVVLSFFDHSLKGEPVAAELFTDVPEIVVRHHSIDARRAATLSN